MSFKRKELTRYSGTHAYIHVDIYEEASKCVYVHAWYALLKIHEVD